MIEKFQNNLKGKLIEYQGKKLYVVDQIYFEGNYYVYTFNAEKYEQTEELEVNFLKKVKDNNLEVVTDMDLFHNLLKTVGSNYVAETIKNFKS